MEAEDRVVQALQRITDSHTTFSSAGADIRGQHCLDLERIARPALPIAQRVAEVVKTARVVTNRMNPETLYTLITALSALDQEKPMSDLDLDSIAARTEATTLGPWEAKLQGQGTLGSGSVWGRGRAYP